MVFHLLKYYQDQNHQLNYVIKIITSAIANTNFFLFDITFHFIIYFLYSVSFNLVMVYW